MWQYLLCKSLDIFDDESDLVFSPANYMSNIFSLAEWMFT
jgi:hypothetical protein